ncbi:MAG: YebC/PmpR family DNA-binding transcriptional regulator [SAR324 cluster bacterium]|nr:YebC/PmpR family DNA-binding transcriptional regulator [SAR324 cluster bacterium]
MSGHSKWSSIKHRKGAQDAKRGKIFTKLIKEITIAARLGGGDVESNPRLRTAISTAKSQSMPKDNIERAIKKGTGELEGVDYEEILYEGYGPHNVAIIVEVMTDNRNRTISFVRSTFSKLGGNLGSPNSVQYMFDHLGQIYIDKTAIDEDSLTELILEAGADDLNTDDTENFEVVTAISSFSQVCEELEGKGIPMASAEIAWVPQNRIEIDDLKKAEQVMRLIDQLEDNDDIQKVYSNFDISDSVLSQMS